VVDVPISVNRGLGVPLVTQIRDQILSAISTGDLPPGERLPTVRQLAEFLGINRNTVAQAYRLLEYDGHVITRAGGGTIVAGDPNAALPGTPKQLREIVHEAFRHARAHGFTAREFAELAYQASAQDDPLPARRIMVVDDYRGELDFVCATVRRAMPGSIVDAFLVTELQAADPTEMSKRLAGVDCALVAFYCLETVRPILTAAGVPIVVAGIGPTLNALRRIADECTGKQVAIICTEPNGPDHMETALRRAGITFTMNPLHAHVHDSKLAQTLAACEVIIASQGSADVVGELAGTTPVIPYSRLISEETLANLRSHTEYQTAQTRQNTDRQPNRT
jgi:DNA-binding transcriptional regulator YhcF (GntR family)